MKRFLLCAALMLTALSGFAQGVKLSAFTTNSGAIVTNIVVSLSSNLAPNRLRATNSVIGLRVYAATNGNGGFWLDPTTITPGAATNSPDVQSGNYAITIVTNALLRTISSPALTNNESRDVTFVGAATLQDGGGDNSVLAASRKLMIGSTLSVDWFNHILNHNEAANDSWRASAERMTNAPVSILRIADGTPLTNGVAGQSLISLGNGGVAWGDATGNTTNGDFSGSFTGNGAGLTNVNLTNVNYTSLAGWPSEGSNLVYRVNVLDYFPRSGVDVTARTIAFQKAMDAVTNANPQAYAVSEIYIPPGDHYVNDTLYFRRNGTVIKGEPGGRTRILLQHATKNLFEFLPTATSGSPDINSLYGCGIEDIDLVCTAELKDSRGAAVFFTSTPSHFIGGNWHFNRVFIANFYRGYDLRFFNMAKFDQCTFEAVNRSYYFDCPQNVEINVGQTFGGRWLVNGLNPTGTNLFGANAEFSAGIFVTNGFYFVGASMGVTISGWEIGDADVAIWANSGQISITGGNFERIHTNAFHLKEIASGIFMNPRLNAMFSGAPTPLYLFEDFTGSRSTIFGGTYPVEITNLFAIQLSQTNDTINYSGEMVQVTNAGAAAFSYYAPQRVVGTITGTNAYALYSTNHGIVEAFLVVTNVTGATGSGGGASGAWNTNGNNGLPASSFIGTTDNYDVELRSSNTTFVRFSGYSNTVIIGKSNFISGWQPYSVIGGGRANLITGPTNSAQNASLGYNVIAGGGSNTISGGSVVGGNTIGGGVFNTIYDDGSDQSVVAGGFGNNLFGASGIISGGANNDIGSSSTIYANFGTIAGGLNNLIVGSTANPSTNDYATVSGGNSNRVSGAYAAIPGGNENIASGSNSFAGGFRANAWHPGSFVWSDLSSTTRFDSAANNEFAVRAAGGMRLSGGAYAGDGSGLTAINASSVTTGTLSQDRFGITNFSAYAAGTAYTMTATPALIDFGTTDPSITINQTGTYLLNANAQIKYVAATYSSNTTVNVKLRKTSGSPADVANATRTVTQRIVTTITGDVAIMQIPAVVYTATVGDVIEIFGNVQALPTAGSVQCVSADIIAIRLY